MCYHVQCNNSSLKSVVVDSGKSHKWGALEIRQLRGSRGGLHKTSCLPIGLRVKFGSSASKGVRINTRELLEIGSARPRPLPMGVAGP